MTKRLFEMIASAILARENCMKSGNAEWKINHERRADYLAYNFLPSGSGLDQGTKIDWERTRPERLVFTASYHHMDECGGYDGWTEHSIIITPSLAFRFAIRITGRDRNGIKEYLTDTYQYALNQEMNDSVGEITKPVVTASNP